MLTKSTSVNAIEKKDQPLSKRYKAQPYFSKNNPFAKKESTKTSRPEPKKEIVSRNVLTRNVDLMKETMESSYVNVSQESSIIRQRRTRRDRGKSFIPTSSV